MTAECPSDRLVYLLADRTVTDLIIGLTNGLVIHLLSDWLKSSVIPNQLTEYLIDLLVPVGCLIGVLTV